MKSFVIETLSLSQHIERADSDSPFRKVVLSGYAPVKKWFPTDFPVRLKVTPIGPTLRERFHNAVLRVGRFIENFLDRRKRVVCTYCRRDYANDSKAIHATL